MELTSSQKGGLAELKIATAAAELGIDVYRPIIEGGRCDLIFDVAGHLLRVQCKWATRRGQVIAVPLRTCRRTPEGYARTCYSATEIEGVAAYCRAVDCCYFLPIGEFDGQTHVHLRLAPARNNQQLGVRMASDYLLGAVAQLGERRHGMAEARGSSPLSSIRSDAPPQASGTPAAPEGTAGRAAGLAPSTASASTP